MTYKSKNFSESSQIRDFIFMNDQNNIMLIQTAESAAIQSLVIGGIIIIIFSFISFLLLKRNRNRLAISLSLYFIFVIIGLVANFIYRLLELVGVLTFSNPTHVVIFSVLNLVTIYFTTLAGVHLLNFNLILAYSSRIFIRKKQWIISLVYAIILLGIFVFGFITLDIGGQQLPGIWWDVHPSPTQTSQVPYYNLALGLYFLLTSQVVFVVIIYFSIMISRKMGKNKYSKKYMNNIIGILMFDIQIIGAFVANTFGSSEIARMIGLIIQLIFVIPGALFLAFGLRKEPENS